MEEPPDPMLTLLDLVHAGDDDAIAAFVRDWPGAELARALGRLEPLDRDRVLTVIGPEQAASALEAVSSSLASDFVQDLPTGITAAIVDEMRSDEQADLLSEMPQSDADAVLREMDPGEARDARELLAYGADTAGGLMRKEFLHFPTGSTVGGVIEDMRENADSYADYAIQYAYVLRDGVLVGVLRLRDLLFSSKSSPVESVMLPDPIAVPVAATIDELRDFFSANKFVGVPVTDARGALLGVVHRASIRQAQSERAEDDLLKVSGIVGGEEIRTMPLRVRARRRLSWLSTNILLNVISASVIAFYEDTLQSVIALAVFLPIISDMSGCSGNQAVTVSIRELALGVVKPNEIARVLGKEASVGVINGLVLGLVLGLAAFLWKGNMYLGVVVGGALAINTLVSVSLGGTLPLILRGLGRDPALAAAPILTTITDLLGFLLALGFATAFLPLLTG